MKTMWYISKKMVNNVFNNNVDYMFYTLFIWQKM